MTSNQMKQLDPETKQPLRSTDMDYVQPDKEALLELCARFFAVSNMGQEWRRGAGWDELMSCTEEEAPGIFEEKNWWKKNLAKVLKKHPECKTLRQLEEEWRKSPVMK